MSARPRSSWLEHTMSTLEGAGYRSSAARSAVVESLARQDCSATARQIADELNDSQGKVSLASVYRALELLDRMRLVQRLDVGEGTTRYEPLDPGGDHHHHLVCDDCGAVTPFEDERLEHAIDQLTGRIDFAVGAHDVILRGQCPRCHRAPARRGRGV